MQSKSNKSLTTVETKIKTLLNFALSLYLIKLCRISENEAINAFILMFCAEQNLVVILYMTFHLIVMLFVQERLYDIPCVCDAVCSGKII